jgi:hypothetical protein
MRWSVTSRILAQLRSSVMQCGQIEQEGCSVQRTHSSNECATGESNMQVKLLQ